MVREEDKNNDQNCHLFVNCRSNINGKKIIRDNCIVKSCFRVTLFFKELNKS